VQRSPGNLPEIGVELSATVVVEHHAVGPRKSGELCARTNDLYEEHSFPLSPRSIGKPVSDRLVGR